MFYSMEGIEIEGDSWGDILKNYENWLYYYARVLEPSRPWTHEDLAQEGHIAMWKALRSYDPLKGSLPSWLTTAAKMRMRDISWRNKPLTGEPSAKGHIREKPATPVDTDWDWVQESVGSQELQESILMAYHQGEIYDAVASLPPRQREYIFRRFWLGETDKSIRNVIPNSPRVWGPAREELSRKLAHLAGIS